MSQEKVLWSYNKDGQLVQNQWFWSKIKKLSGPKTKNRDWPCKKKVKKFILRQSWKLSLWRHVLVLFLSFVRIFLCFRNSFSHNFSDTVFVRSIWATIARSFNSSVLLKLLHSSRIPLFVCFFCIWKIGNLENWWVRKPLD